MFVILIIIGIYAERNDPKTFGFDYDDWDGVMRLMQENQKEFEYHKNARYAPIVRAMRKNYRRDEIPSELLWFYDMKF